jgi:hypothetical protein
VSLVQEIQQLGLPKENSDAIARHYRENKDNLRTVFANSSYKVSTLLSTSWRVDLTVASSEGNSITPIAHLKFAIDTKPNDRSPSGSISNPENRVTELACELSSDKLDVLIHELTQAQGLMDSMGL